MFGNKTAVWVNELGMRAEFDNHRGLYLESIDMTGNSAVLTSSALAGADGQTTTGCRLAPKVIPCSFAWYSPENNDFMTHYLTALFNPKYKGTLTVRTKTDTYEIECRPQSFPVFEREAVGCVWRWSVDFVADYPYWSVGTEKIVTLDSSAVTVRSVCPYDIPPRIVFPAFGSNVTLQVQYRLRVSESWSTQVSAFTVKGSLNGTTRDFPLTIDVKTLRITNASGGNVNNWVDASAQTDRALIRYGFNQIVCSASAAFPSGQRPVLHYRNLSQGEA